MQQNSNRRTKSTEKKLTHVCSMRGQCSQLPTETFAAYTHRERITAAPRSFDRSKTHEFFFFVNAKHTSLKHVDLVRV
jgi:hypothetical protein